MWHFDQDKFVQSQSFFIGLIQFRKEGKGKVVNIVVIT